MSSFELTIATFAVWWLIGLGLLAAVGADTSSLRRTLTAPALGSAVTVLALFVFSEAGMAIEHCAVPIALVLSIGAVLALALRRPRIHPGALAVLGICGVGLLIIGGPMRTFGYAWISNANDDMSNYVLSATDLLHHGLLASFDVSGLAHDRDYPTVMEGLHLAGSRPGADIALAAFSRVTGRLPYEVFMPLIFSFVLSGACAAGALALQATRRWWAALIAAALLMSSPLATYGALQQLMPQVWGLGLAAALFALLMRPELHRAPGPRLSDLIPIGVLATSLILVYVELASTLFAAYVLYVVVIALRRETDLRSLARLWMPAGAILVVVLNAYLVRELVYVTQQAGSGLSPSSKLLGNIPTFGYTLVPISLPGFLGLVQLPSGSGELGVDFAIALAGFILIALFLASLLSARRGVAAAVVVVEYAVLALVLESRSSDFGLFKLFMYAQPFLAVMIAVLVAQTPRRWAALACIPVAALIYLALPVQNKYVEYSRDPIDLPNASSGQLLPTFKRYYAAAHEPVIAITENPALGKIEASTVGDHPLYYISADLFAALLNAQTQSKRRAAEEQRAAAAAAWPPRSFDLLDPGGPAEDQFNDNPVASSVLASGHCTLVLPTGSELVVNRFSLPEGSPDLIQRKCDEAHDLLVFTNSDLGAGFYAFAQRKNKTFYQLEADPFGDGHTMSGIGRYLLFRVLGLSPGSRIELDFTDTYRHDGSDQLPPASVVGDRRYPFLVVGRGSARLFSPPIKPQMIDGQPFVLIDLGRDGRVLPGNRSGIQGLYDSKVPLDPRFLTGYARDISLVSASQYANLQAPMSVSDSPAGLANPNLQYSGLYEDGWVSSDSYVVLGGGPAAELLVQGAVPEHAGGQVEVSMNGRRLSSTYVKPGPLEIRVPIGASSERRRVELHFSSSIRLAAPDLRPASAHLSFIGFVPHS